MPPRPGTSEPWSTSSEVSDAIFIRLGMKTLRELAGDNAYVPGNHISLGVKLGEGAYAVVREAVYVGPRPEGSTSVISGQKVAVKMLKPEKAAVVADVVSFIEEARMLARLRHTNIVRFIACGSFNTSCPEAEWRSMFMVVEYMDCSLKNMLHDGELKNKNVYTYAAGLGWCINVAEALECMHTSTPSIIHRDVKSENVLLTTDGGVTVAKLADLGLHMPIFPAHYARDMGSRSRSSSMEQDANAANRTVLPDHHTIIPRDSSYGCETDTFKLTGKTGACTYMAPEVFQTQNYNRLVDVFALGIVIYEIFSRRLVSSSLPDVENPAEDYANRVALGHRPPFTDNMPPELRQLINDCWSGLPKLRPQAGEVVRRLKKMQEAGMAAEMDTASSTGCCSVM